MKTLIIILNIICTVLCAGSPDYQDYGKNISYSINSLTSKPDGITKTPEPAVQPLPPPLQFTRPIPSAPQPSQIDYKNAITKSHNSIYSQSIISKAIPISIPVQSSISTSSSSSSSSVPQTVTSSSITIPSNTQSLMQSSPTGYLIAINTHSGQQHIQPAILPSGSTPVIMQYLPQTNQQMGGIQYLQLIPTRPLIVPISPYISQSQPQQQQLSLQKSPIQFNQQTPQLQQQQSQQLQQIQQQQQQPPQSQQQFHSQLQSQQPQQQLQQRDLQQEEFQPIISNNNNYNTNNNNINNNNNKNQVIQSQQQTSQSINILTAYPNPIGAYASPILSYFRPNAGMQIVNGPIDLSLNTNEYVPV